MKTFFSVLISYILLSIFGAVLVSALIMVYMGCMNYVVGQPLALVSFEAFRLGFDISMPLVLIFCPMFLVLSLIRHSKKNHLIGFITIAVLSAASWIFGMPAFLKYESGKADSSIIKSQRLSSGYFRLSENTIYYFTNVDLEKNTEGIAISEQPASGKQAFSVIDNKKITIPDSEYFSDILVKRVVEMPPLLKNFMQDLYNLSGAAVKAFSSSTVSWLFFCSFALSLIFVFAVANVSQWRLINAFFVLVATTVVIKLNCICYGISFYEKYISFLPSLDSSLKHAFGFISGIQSPLCVVVNILLVLIFGVLGIVGLFTNRSRKNEDDE